MKKVFYTLMILLLVGSGCKKDSNYLDKKPQNLLTPEQIYSKETLITSVLADFYNRLPDGQRTPEWYNFLETNEGFASYSADYYRNQKADYAFNIYYLWDYGFIRDINVFLQEMEKVDETKIPGKKRLIGEGRYIRAYMYFEMVKRNGGVPLILEPLTYDFSGDVTKYQFPRKKESEIYDFVISEMDAIKADLPIDVNLKARATQALAMGTKARAALYAASIAKYGAGTPTVSLPGGEVGIEAAKAEGYYKLALSASKEIISGSLGAYGLYKKKPDLQDNFASLFIDKTANNEVLFVKDYKLPNVAQRFTEEVMPRSMTESGSGGGKLNPTLNLAQEFELLDNTFAPFATDDANGNPVYYTNQQDIFANRDARLGGTIIYPGAAFRGRAVDIWAGYLKADGSIVSSGTPGGNGQLNPSPAPAVKSVGLDGPINNVDFTAQTGFYLRKYVDPQVGTAIFPGSEVWWIRYRYADILLMAAEAAFELNLPSEAVGYINEVRQRAGFTTNLSVSDMTFDRIVHERQVEFAFEGLLFWDLKRWRLADKVWNGNPMTVTNVIQNIGKADKTATNQFGLWPYKYYNPGNANDGKWVYRVIKPASVLNARRFRLGNYYSEISQTELTNNPKLVKNPNQ